MSWSTRSTQVRWAGVSGFSHVLQGSFWAVLPSVELRRKKDDRKPEQEPPLLACLTSSRCTKDDSGIQPRTRLRMLLVRPPALRCQVHFHLFFSPCWERASGPVMARTGLLGSTSDTHQHDVTRKITESTAPKAFPNNSRFTEGPPRQARRRWVWRFISESRTCQKASGHLPPSGTCSPVPSALFRMLTPSLLHVLPSVTVGGIYPSVLPPPVTQDTTTPITQDQHNSCWPPCSTDTLPKWGQM